MKDELLKKINDTIICDGWDCGNLLIRAMFTTLIYIENMFIEDAVNILKELYDYGDIEDCDISFEEFKEFMLHDINKQF
ncbi:TPA: hypothetical protein LA460_000275 [Clostridium botulinum]|nr:hypothetical protein [Clostridium botulinum]HBJ1652879.1 hypothetical protein [Clostridium botulinum]